MRPVRSWIRYFLFLLLFFVAKCRQAGLAEQQSRSIKLQSASYE